MMPEQEIFTPLSLPSANGGVKAYHWARGTFLLLIAFILFGVGAWLWPYDPVDYRYIKLTSFQVKAGDALEYYLYMDKHTTLTPNITRILVSTDHPEDDVVIQGTTIGMAYMEQKFKRIIVGIPKWVRPGKYYIRCNVVYPYWGGNVMVEAPYRTPCFEVIK